MTSPVQIEPIAPIMAVERRRRLDVIALFNSLLRSLEIFEQELCWECSGLRFNVHVGRLRAFSTAVLAFCFYHTPSVPSSSVINALLNFKIFTKLWLDFKKKNFVGNVQDHVLMSTWADWGRFQRQFWSFVFIMRQVLHRLSLRCRTLFQSLKAFWWFIWKRALLKLFKATFWCGWLLNQLNSSGHFAFYHTEIDPSVINA